MAKNIVRTELDELEKSLQDAIKIDFIESEFAKMKYKPISSVIDFMKKNTDPISGNKLKSMIFVIGATGAGKSTLINYINSASNFVASKNDGKLEVTTNSIAEIGDGSGSTTLFPNVWLSPYGNFLDCPGEGDTGGIIAEAVESIFKSKVSNNVEELKIVFVVTQASLGSEAGYGMSFKHALDKNAQFLNDIHHFKNSMAFVISSASVKKSALEESVKLINNIVNHANIGAYKDTISHIISLKNVATFSKPAESLEIGDPYCPPSWNPNQQENIIELIERLPYTPVPNKDFFNVSTSANVRETMDQALKIVKKKAGLSLRELVEKASPFRVFAVELKPFVKYLGGMVNGYDTDLSSYVKMLAWNNYLKIDPKKEVFNQLNEEMIFLSQFTKGPNEDEKQSIKLDWARTADLTEILTTTRDNAHSILNSPGNNFLKWATQGNVTPKPSSGYAVDILKDFKLLFAKYVEQEEMERLKRDQDSKYFYEKALQVVSGFEDIPYTETIPYNDVENYTDEEQYVTVKKVTKKVKRFRPVTKFKTEEYTEMTPETKFRTETYEEKEAAPVRSGFLKFFTVGLSGSVTDTVIKTREVPYNEFVPTTKSRDVPYIDNVSYSEDEDRFEPVTETKKVHKSRTVVKYREEEKTRKDTVYKDEITKEFNSEKYGEDSKRIDDDIAEYRKLITDKLVNMYPKALKLGEHSKDSIICMDNFEKKYEGLLDLWQEAEYGAYFAENPDNSLAEFDIQDISNLAKDIWF